MMVIRAAELPPPHRTPVGDFDAICDVFQINNDHRGSVRRHLDEIVDGFAALIRGERMRPDRQADRDRLRRAASDVAKARRVLQAPMGVAGEFAWPTAGRLLGPMVTARWLRERFPASGLAPAPSDIVEMTYGVRRGPMPRRPRKRQTTQLDIEEDSLHARVRFAEERPAELFSTVLAEIEDALNAALRLFPLLPGARGGRQPLTQRQYVIVNLAICWHSLDRVPTGGPNSAFAAFCEAVFESIGWPTDGVDAAVPRALVIWRNRTKKTLR